jgi:hypothetical protein
MPFESSLPLVIVLLLAAAAAGAVWFTSRSRGAIAVAGLLVTAAIGAAVADRLVVTDREFLEELFPRLARAAEARDAAPIMATLEPDLGPLREQVRKELAEARPTEVRITRLEVTVDPAKRPPEAVARMLVRVTGEFVEKGSRATGLVAARVLLAKKGEDWLIQDADIREAKPGRDL